MQGGEDRESETDRISERVSVCACVFDIASNAHAHIDTQTLLHTATHCNTLQHTATHYNGTHIAIYTHNLTPNAQTHIDAPTLQHPETHSITLQYTATALTSLQGGVES